jgi:hypothetical protein
MSTSSEAEENLRVIRSLMEKATSYRAVSAPAAALGGVLAVGASFAFGSWLMSAPVGTLEVISPLHFLWLWLGVLAITAAANFFFLWKDAQKRGDVFISSRMKMAALALLPSYLVASFCTFAFIESGTPNLVVSSWIICHGLALLGTAHFAPRSLVLLGWAFLVAGFVSACALSQANAATPPNLVDGVSGKEAVYEGIVWLRNHGLLVAQGWMAGTFGLFHLIYAACTWPRKSRSAGGA